MNGKIKDEGGGGGATESNEGGVNGETPPTKGKGLPTRTITNVAPRQERKRKAAQKAGCISQSRDDDEDTSDDEDDDNFEGVE